MTDSRERQTSNLLALLDGEIADPSTRQALVDRAGAQAELDELDALRQSLQVLSDIEPDPEVWARIEARTAASPAGDEHDGTNVIQAGGLFRTIRAPYAMAAGLLLAVTVSLVSMNVVRELPPPVVANADVGLETLLDRSRQLEPLAKRASYSQGDPSERALKYRIADLDTQIETYPTSAALWGQRVALLESLAEVRRARAALQPAVY